MFVFFTPLLPGKQEEFQNAISLNSLEEKTLFQDVGITACLRWIQKLPEQELVIHLIKGENMENSLQSLSRYIANKDPRALRLCNLYQEFCASMPFIEPKFLSQLTPLLEVAIEAPSSLMKEYCFVYPIMDFKKHQLLTMFDSVEKYFSQPIQDIYAYRGVTKHQFWIQEHEKHSFLVLYQQIVGPVIDARAKYLEAKNEEFARTKAIEFSEVTGLNYEQLLPQLTSLQDFEILQ